MRTIIKYASAATLAGALGLAMTTPSQARHWRHGGGGALGGFIAGAAIGAVAANSYYGPGYYGPGYYAPGYAYGPGPYAGPYAYEPAPVYYAAPARVYGGGGCWHVTDSDRGYGYYGAC